MPFYINAFEAHFKLIKTRADTVLLYKTNLPFNHDNSPRFKSARLPSSLPDDKNKGASKVFPETLRGRNVAVLSGPDGFFFPFSWELCWDYSSDSFDVGWQEFTKLSLKYFHHIRIPEQTDGSQWNRSALLGGWEDESPPWASQNKVGKSKLIFYNCLFFLNTFS